MGEVRGGGGVKRRWDGLAAGGRGGIWLTFPGGGGWHYGRFKAFSGFFQPENFKYLSNNRTSRWAQIRRMPQGRHSSNASLFF